MPASEVCISYDRELPPQIETLDTVSLDWSRVQGTDIYSKRAVEFWDPRKKIRQNYFQLQETMLQN